MLKLIAKIHIILIIIGFYLIYAPTFLFLNFFQFLIHFTRTFPLFLIQI